MSEETQLAPESLIGRRLFSDAASHRSLGPPFDFSEFVDTRLRSDLSVDILGSGNPESKRLKTLTVLARNEGEARLPPTSFGGWAAILLKDLKFPGWQSQVRSVPIVASEHKASNVFHAEISRDGFREKAQSYAFATMMADRFSRRGRFVPPSALERRAP